MNVSGDLLEIGEGEGDDKVEAPVEACRQTYARAPEPKGINLEMLIHLHFGMYNSTFYI